MKLQQMLLFRWRAPGLCSTKGSPTRFELQCSKLTRFHRFLQCSRTSVKKTCGQKQRNANVISLNDGAMSLNRPPSSGHNLKVQKTLKLGSQSFGLQGSCAFHIKSSMTFLGCSVPARSFTVIM